MHLPALPAPARIKEVSLAPGDRKGNSSPIPDEYCSYRDHEGGWASGLTLAACESSGALGQPDLIRKGWDFHPQSVGGLDKRARAWARDRDTEELQILSETDLSRGSRGCFLYGITEYGWDSLGVVKHPQKACIILWNFPYSQFNDYYWVSIMRLAVFGS